MSHSSLFYILTSSFPRHFYFYYSTITIFVHLFMWLVHRTRWTTLLTFYRLYSYALFWFLFLLLLWCFCSFCFCSGFGSPLLAFPWSGLASYGPVHLRLGYGLALVYRFIGRPGGPHLRGVPGIDLPWTYHLPFWFLPYAEIFFFSLFWVPF